MSTRALHVQKLLRSAGYSEEEVATFVDAACTVGGHVLQTGARVWVPDFGTFEPRVRTGRVVRNPKTHELMQLPATRSLGFSPGKHTRRWAANEELRGGR